MNDLKYRSTKNISLNYFEKKTSILKNEGYYLWKLSKKWESVVGKLIGEYSDPKYLKNGTLIINVDDSTIYHNLLTYQNELINKINLFYEKKLVHKLEIKKINKLTKKNIIDEIEKSKEKEIEIQMTKLNKEILQKNEENYEKIKLTSKELEEIEKSINNINPKYSEYAQKLQKIAINLKKRDKYLLENGYKMCKKCGEIFYPGNNENICFNCYENEEKIKELEMIDIIKRNPYISEKEAVRLSNTEAYIYYKVRDILAQRVYGELLFFCENINLEVELSRDYTNEIRKEAKEELEKLIKNYVDYKIGTDDQNIFLNERKKIMKRIKNELFFKNKKN